MAQGKEQEAHTASYGIGSPSNPYFANPSNFSAFVYPSFTAQAM